MYGADERVAVGRLEREGPVEELQGAVVVLGRERQVRHREGQSRPVLAPLVRASESSIGRVDVWLRPLTEIGETNQVVGFDKSWVVVEQQRERLGLTTLTGGQIPERQQGARRVAHERPHFVGGDRPCVQAVAREAQPRIARERFLRGRLAEQRGPLGAVRRKAQHGCDLFVGRRARPVRPKTQLRHDIENVRKREARRRRARRGLSGRHE